MTDAQFAALLSAVIAGLGGIAATLRWSIGRITNAIDSNTAAYKESAKAQLEQAIKFSELSTKITDVTSWVHEHTPVDAIPTAASRAAPTAPILTRGYRPPRPGAHDD